MSYMQIIGMRQKELKKDIDLLTSYDHRGEYLAFMCLEEASLLS